MIKIIKSNEAWHLYDDRQSLEAIQHYDDIRDLLKDLEFLLEVYNKCQEFNMFDSIDYVLIYVAIGFLVCSVIDLKSEVKRIEENEEKER